MSEQPEEKAVSDQLTDNIRDAFSEAGMMLTGLLCLATYISDDGSRCFALCVGPGQGPETTAGLSDVIQQFAMEQLRLAFPIGSIVADGE